MIGLYIYVRKVEKQKSEKQYSYKQLQLTICKWKKQKIEGDDGMICKIKKHPSQIINMLQYLMDPNAIKNDEQAAAGRSLGATIAVMAIFFGLFNLPFIVPSLIYAYEGTLCLELIPYGGISFNLATWLEVDSYMRVGVISLLLIVALVSCKSLDAGASMLICAAFIILIYTLFHFIWLIVGSVLIWGQVNPTGICFGPVQTYIYALLIISFGSIFCICAMGGKFIHKHELI